MWSLHDFTSQDGQKSRLQSSGLPDPRILSTSTMETELGGVLGFSSGVSILFIYYISVSIYGITDIQIGT